MKSSSATSKGWTQFILHRTLLNYQYFLPGNNFYRMYKIWWYQPQRDWNLYAGKLSPILDWIDRRSRQLLLNRFFDLSTIQASMKKGRDGEKNYCNDGVRQSGISKSTYKKLSSIEGCLPKRVVFHWKSSSIEGHLPLQLVLDLLIICLGYGICFEYACEIAEI